MSDTANKSRDKRYGRQVPRSAVDQQITLSSSRRSAWSKLLNSTPFDLSMVVALNREPSPNTARAQARLKFAEQALARSLTMRVASADASFRSYWRVQTEAEVSLVARSAVDKQSWIVMDAPPEREDCRPFVEISQRLLAAKVRAPRVLQADFAQGFLLLDDLGTRMLLPALTADSVHALYSDALQELVTLRQVSVQGLPHYDAERLGAELDLFPDWFIARHLGLAWTPAEQALWATVRARLIERALAQEQVFVHRDFHSRNLMLGPQHPQHSDRFGVLDFQDAVCGPASYDLVSLLRDCYIEWPDPSVRAWIQEFHARAGLSIALDRFQQDVDWMGLQRHLKVLGIFARLNYRDHKSSYLNDLPLVLRYTLRCASAYPELEAFARWLEGACAGIDLTQARSEHTA
jgi:N-acetylmuramate 1-kinase